ncbi:MAG: S41 family peptidase [Prolixibacteraceae bacterium]|jgi:C-terminal processing protease CtpA/Prc|nr:S41 family peptidase [Prolixibacteraceae bacterium]
MKTGILTIGYVGIRYFLRAVLLPLFFIVGFTACDPNHIPDDDGTTDISEEILAVNEWIDGVMKEVYLWSNKIPSSVNYKKEADPEELFNKMLYTEEDTWSWITDDWASYKKELEGTPVSMGYSPAFFYKNQVSNEVIIIIRFVYKNSPADKAGLKRGDIILTIDGQALNDENYYDLYSGPSYTVGLGTYHPDPDVFSSNGVSKTITAATVTANPVIHYEVKEIEGKRIGYLVYTDFTSGVNNSFLKSVDAVVDSFKQSAITDLIIDLRYNPGGSPGTATYLASSVVPRYVVEDKKIFLKMVYNRNLQNYFERQDDGDTDLHYRFAASAGNLNLSKVYFLTAKGTASASEALITGLKPYMDVIMVGDTTRGKYTGAWVIPDTNEPPKHNWCIVPIVLKYSNASGFTDFKNGIAPDIFAYDYLIPAYPFGNLNDGVLAAAIGKITGTQLLTTKSAVKKPVFTGSQELRPREMERRETLIVPRKNMIGE